MYFDLRDGVPIRFLHKSHMDCRRETVRAASFVGHVRLYRCGFDAYGLFLAPSLVGGRMRYIVAWLLGVPLSVIVIWYLVGHAACGR